MKSICKENGRRVEGEEGKRGERGGGGKVLYRDKNKIKHLK